MGAWTGPEDMRRTDRLRSLILCITMLIAVLSIGMADSQCVFASGETHYIAVASDRHETPTAIRTAMSGMPSSVEYVCLNGDMANFARGQGRGAQNPYNTSTVLAEVLDVFPELDASAVSIIYAGHDSNATDDAGIIRNADTSLLPTADSKDIPEISEGQSGLIYTGEGDSYYIYGVSFRDMQDADAAAASAAKFRDWADSVDPDIPVIVISHVPIHTIRHDNPGGSAWNKALNYAATGTDNGTEIVRDVAFLFGHNHTVEAVEYNAEPGDTIHPEGDEEASIIYYNYITAGYLRDLHTATLIAVTDDTLSFTKYTGDPDSDDPSVPSLLSERDRVRYLTVTFDTGTGSAVESQRILSGHKAVQPPDPAGDGYMFTGWYTDQEHSALYDFSAEVTADIVLYAGWEESSEPAADDEEDGADEETSPREEENKPQYEAKPVTDTAGSDGSGVSYTSPRTGDDNRIILWALLMMISSAEFAVLLLMKRRI